MKRFMLAGAMAIALPFVGNSFVDGQTFSTTELSFDATGALMFGDDIFAPSPISGVVSPPVVLPGGGGIVGPVDVDGFTYGRHFRINPQNPFPLSVDFSVDAASGGIVAGSGLDVEFTGGGPGENNYDVYRTNLGLFPGTNVQKHDGDGAGFGVASPLGIFEPQITGGPNFLETGVDGYDSRSVPGRSIYWSWDPFWAPPLGSISGADVMISPSVPGYDGLGGVYAPSFLLGLDTFGIGTDNIDALEVFDLGVIGVFDAPDVVLFSLDPLSASLAAPSPYFGFSSADILFATGGGATGLAIPSFALGLGPNDNVTALSIPEPSMLLLGSIGIALIANKRRRT